MGDQPIARPLPTHRTTQAGYTQQLRSQYYEDMIGLLMDFILQYSIEPEIEGQKIGNGYCAHRIKK
jgi:hypothetical protein